MESGRSSNLASICRPSRGLSARTTFIGREAELRRLVDLVERERLVTVLGLGGVGKTRLVVEAIPRLRDRFGRRVEFVELAGLADPQFLLSTIGASVGASSPDDPFSVLGEHFDQDSLLVLDNFEHLVAAATVLADLIDSCPHLHVVVTSRVALRLRGERELVVGPLGLPPEPREVTRLPAALSIESVALFVDRARARGLDVSSMTKEDLAAVADICSRLGGWPLAIELAAARVKLLGLRGLAERLTDPLSVLGDGSVDGPPRHRTISDTVAWSHDLLEPADRLAFAALSTFVNGFTVDAASALLASDAATALQSIGHLVDQSLLDVDLSAPDARFSMLEPVREFAYGTLETDARLTLAARHFEFFLSLAERQVSAERGADQGTWLRRLTVERDNIRKALRFARDAGDGAGLLRLAAALERRFWISSGLGLSEGMAWLEAGLEAGRDAPPALRGRALMRLAWAIDSSPRDVADVIEQALAEYESVSDVEGQIDALAGLGTVAAHTGDAQAAEAWLERGLGLAADLGSRRDLQVELLIPLSQAKLGRGNVAEARSLLHAAIDVARSIGDQWGLSYGLSQLGQLALANGEADEAERMLSSSRRMALDAGDAEEFVAATMFLSASRMMVGDLGGARDLIRAAADEDKRTASRVLTLDAISLWLLLAGKHEAADVALAVADRAAEGRITRRSGWMPVRRAIEGVLRAGAKASSNAGARPNLSVTAAIAFGLDQMAGDMARPESTLALSPREHQVLGYVVRGRSDAEIAQELFISKKTVSVHVSRIKDKLHAQSRVGIALAALRVGLVREVTELPPP